MVRYDDQFSAREDRRAARERHYHDDAWMRRQDDAAEKRAAQHYAHIDDHERARLQLRLQRRVAVAKKRAGQ